MNTFYKRILTVLIIAISFLIINPIEVYATNLDYKQVSVQCIYSNGELFTYSYNNALEKFSTSSGKYNLQGTDQQQNSSSQPSYINRPVTGGGGSWVSGLYTESDGTNDSVKCKSYMHSVIYPTISDADENNPAITFYKFGNSDDAATIHADSDGIKSNSWWCKIWGCTSKSVEKINDSQTSNFLVSESYTIGSEAPDPNVSIYYLKEEEGSTEQATNTAGHIEVMVYDNVVLVRNGDYTARLSGYDSAFTGASRDETTQKVSGAPKTIHINSPEPKTTPNTTGGSGISYTIAKGQTNYSRGSNRYVLTDATFDDGDGDVGSVCDEMPNTAIVLRDIIGYMQLLVPLFMIVISGVDIGKIVFSGEIENDLPKVKKKILIRLIVGAAFFFLPLLASLLIDFYNQSGVDSDHQIKEIRCLFQ